MWLSAVYRVELVMRLFARYRGSWLCSCLLCIGWSWVCGCLLWIGWSCVCGSLLCIGWSCVCGCLLGIGGAGYVVVCCV